MKKSILLLCVFSFLFGCAGVKDKKNSLSLIWEMGENNIERGAYESTFYLVNNLKDSVDNNWVIYFNQRQGSILSVANEGIEMEPINATYYKMYPSKNYKKIGSGDTLQITYRARGSVLKESGSPEGAYCVWLDDKGNDASVESVSMKVVPFSNDKQWSREGASETPYPYGELVYSENAIFTEPVDLKVTDIFPSVKEVVRTDGVFKFTNDVNLVYDAKFKNEADLLKEKLARLYNIKVSAEGKTKIVLKEATISNAKNDEHYRINITKEEILIEGTTTHAIFNGTQTLVNMLSAGNFPIEIPLLSINDYPDLEHRGFMLDVARNFTKKENVLKLIDVLSSYKLSVLHMHLTDDEGWRIEIPGIEELTDVGSKRGHTYDESQSLYPAYGGGWDSEDKENSANGYYTKADFVEILKYATARHIKVIPEIDLPAHARAAIRATTARYHKYKDTDKVKAEEYLLEDFEDSSKYVSVQGYTNNSINVALPSAYTFVTKVVDEVNAMYKEAGLTLDVFHLGGDEVPKGAWTGSDICKKFMADNKMTDVRELKDYFIAQTIDILKERGMQMGAWQEVGLLPDQSVNTHFAKDNVLSYAWNTLPDWKGDEIPYRLANAGYPVILCNISNFYFDLSYNKHQEEPGAYWGGFVNEYNSFDALPYNIYSSVKKNMKGESIDFIEQAKSKVKLSEQAKQNIKGVQAQLWTESIRNFYMVEHYVFPKIFGLVERGWNAHPSWENNPLSADYTEALKLYNAKITQKEMPRLTLQDVQYRIGLPGVEVKNGTLLINSPIVGSETYYTTDGSVPTKKSHKWTKAILVDAEVIRAKSFYEGRESATTLWRKK